MVYSRPPDFSLGDFQLLLHAGEGGELPEPPRVRASSLSGSVFFIENFDHGNLKLACMLLSFASGTEFLSLSLCNHLKLPELSEPLPPPFKSVVTPRPSTPSRRGGREDATGSSPVGPALTRVRYPALSSSVPGSNVLVAKPQELTKRSGDFRAHLKLRFQAYLQSLGRVRRTLSSMPRP